MECGEAIARLIAAVEAGGCNGSIYDALRDLPVEYTARTMDAYNGSLDAAKALHEAVLPGWHFTVWSSPRGEYGCTFITPDGMDHLDSEYAATEARARLLAILRALQSEAE